jgi:hypothetical protein
VLSSSCVSDISPAGYWGRFSTYGIKGERGGRPEEAHPLGLNTCTQRPHCTPVNTTAPVHLWDSSSLVWAIKRTGSAGAPHAVDESSKVTKDTPT